MMLFGGFGEGEGEFLEEVGFEGDIDHVIDEGAGSVERACLFAGRFAGFGVEGGEEVFKDLAEEFGVKSDLFFDGSIFGDGELVALKDFEESAHLGGSAFFVAKFCGKVDLLGGRKEEEVGDVCLFFWISRETVGVKDFFCFFVFDVEAVKESAVEKGDILEEGEGMIGFLEERAVTVEIFDAMLFSIFGKAVILGKGAMLLLRGIHELVEGGEEEVLQDSVVIGRRLGIVEVVEGGGERVGLEEHFGDEFFFFEEPAKDQAGEKADDAGSMSGIGIFFDVIGEVDVPSRPEVPRGDILIKALIEQFDVQDVFEGFVKFGEGAQGLEALCL